MSDALERKKLLRTNPRRLIKKSERSLRQKVIETRKEALVAALKVPPAINQFRTFLNADLMAEVEELFGKYKPETRAEHKRRLKKEKEFGKVGPKPNIVKSGSKHVTTLIEEGRAKLVLIACDVDPIEVVLFLPTLCKKMGVPYALVRSKHELGKLVNQKATTCVCLCNVNKEDKGRFENLIARCNSLFADKYEIVMKEWGLPAVQSN
ncbi:60S ribosomal protein L7a [Dictyocoela roeselum]|nr:60S ribosomal protein L7a [Dictyocoela roeselum]